MNEITQILNAMEAGDPGAAEKLLPLAYNELRRMAAAKMAAERDGHTLQPTALVHEAYLRLSGPDGIGTHWKSRGHFFAAAGQAMRRILIESARRKATGRRGGDFARTEYDAARVPSNEPRGDILAVDEALRKLEAEDPELARIVTLRYFAGLSIPEIAAALDVSSSTVDRGWRCARAWLYREVTQAAGA